MSRTSRKPGDEIGAFICQKCGRVAAPSESGTRNRIAGDDNEGALLALALRPVMILPFPAERLMAGLKNLDTAGAKHEL